MLLSYDFFVRLVFFLDTCTTQDRNLCDKLVRINSWLINTTYWIIKPWSWRWPYDYDRIVLCTTHWEQIVLFAMFVSVYWANLLFTNLCPLELWEICQTSDWQTRILFHADVNLVSRNTQAHARPHTHTLPTKCTRAFLNMITNIHLQNLFFMFFFVAACFSSYLILVHSLSQFSIEIVQIRHWKG